MCAPFWLVARIAVFMALLALCSCRPAKIQEDEAALFSALKVRAGRCMGRDPSNAVNNIAILGIARSGTTLMMHLLSALDNQAFILPEPYTSWEELPEVIEAPAPPALFNCTSLNKKRVIFSLQTPFACNNTPHIAQSSALFQRCLKQSIEAEEFQSWCQHASLRIVKFLRLPLLARHRPLEGLLQSTQAIKFIHIVRNPAVSVKSQYVLGWIKDHNLDELAERACQDILFHQSIIESLPANSTLTVRYEDLTSEFADVMSRIVCRFRLPVSDASWQRIVQQTRLASAEFRSPMYDDDNDWTLKAVKAVRKSPSCLLVARRYHYSL
jgi:hypothetical protein